MKSAGVSRKRKSTASKPQPLNIVCEQCGPIGQAMSTREALDQRDFHSFDHLHDVSVWFDGCKLVALIGGSRTLDLRPAQ